MISQITVSRQSHSTYILYHPVLLGRWKYICFLFWLTIKKIKCFLGLIQGKFQVKNFQNRKCILLYSGKKRKLITAGHGENLEVIKIVCVLIVMWVQCTYLSKLSIHLKWVQFVLYKWYHNDVDKIEENIRKISQFRKKSQFPLNFPVHKWGFCSKDIINVFSLTTPFAIVLKSNVHNSISYFTPTQTLYLRAPFP